MSKKVYDEKQLIDRGTAFQYAFISSIILNVIIFILSYFIGIGMTESTQFLINLGVPIFVYMITVILKNVYDGTKPDGEKLNVSSLGGCGIALLILYLPDVVSGKALLFDNNVFSDNVGALFTGILMILIFVIYWIKNIQSKK
ncbi:MAG: hypothetical protein LUG46_05200, partial [Erysipelotrichaceae bacterium]|nr:hypothetical protein [Erysipelotrichaceae bacterium]